MTINDVRQLVAAHLIRTARDDIPVDKVREYLTAFGVPRHALRDELQAIAEVINNAQISVTWEVTSDAGTSAHSGHQH